MSSVFQFSCRSSGSCLNGLFMLFPVRPPRRSSRFGVHVWLSFVTCLVIVYVTVRSYTDTSWCCHVHVLLVSMFSFTLHFTVVALGTDGGQCPPGRVGVFRHAAPRSVNSLICCTPRPFWLKACLNNFFGSYLSSFLRLVLYRTMKLALVHLLTSAACGTFDWNYFACVPSVTPSVDLLLIAFFGHLL